MTNPLPWDEFTQRVVRLYRVGRRRPSTISKAKQVLKEIQQLGATSTTDLTSDLILRWLEAHPRRTPDTAKGLLGYLRTSCLWAVEEGWLDRPPSFRRLMPKIDGSRQKRHLSLDEIRRLLRLLQERSRLSWEDSRLYAVVATVAMTGMRRNEALFLRKKDVNLKSRFITLESIPERPLKTPSSGQPVPIPSELVPILAAWRPQAGCKWLFPGLRRKSAWSGGQVGKRPIDGLRRAGKEAKIKSRLSWHLFRHSWATHAETAWGLTEPQIQRTLRHTTSRTQRLYRHADCANLDKIAAQVRFDLGA